MRGLPGLDVHESHRVRRWDAVVLGSALPGLVAAARLAMRGAQVLVIEEETAVTSFAGLREPFLMTGDTSDSPLGACLSAIGVPLIDRRNLLFEPIAYQIVWPGTRLNFGDVERTADEFDCWNLAERRAAQDWLQQLERATASEGSRLLASQLASATRRPAFAGRMPARTQAPPTATHPTVDHTIASAPGLAAIAEAQVRALADFGDRAPQGVDRDRLIGTGLGGAVTVGGKDPWLASLLRRRIEARHGAFRRLSGALRIVQSGNLPVVIADESRDASAARALLVNAPATALIEMDRRSNPEPTPNTQSAQTWLGDAAPSARRLSLHLRGDRRLLPEAMAPRVVCIRDLSAPMTGTNVVRVRWFERGTEVDLLADTTVAADSRDDDRALEDIGRSIVSLMPLGDEGWSRVAIPEPLWDRSDLLADPHDASGDPIPGLRQPIARVPVYVIDGSRSARRGFEGDLMLGWQAGDAIGAELG